VAMISPTGQGSGQHLPGGSTDRRPRNTIAPAYSSGDLKPQISTQRM
jgi:hypothetical protein